MTPELRNQCLNITGEFIEWLVGKSLLQASFILDYMNYDLRSELAELEAARILRNQIAHGKGAAKRWQDCHDSEPLYMVSRIKSGKIWLIYATLNGYDEFGPVVVPLGVTDIVKPGWCIECSLGLSDGRWQMRSSGKVLAV
jgi:hypothetical protein